jgi:hypothetical protein
MDTRAKWGGFGEEKNPWGCLLGENKTHRV